MAVLTFVWSVSFGIGFISVLLIALVTRWTTGKRSLKLEGKILLITAHPDDECMFFAPTIISSSLTHSNAEIFLLCLSEGNYCDQGHIRRTELVKSAAVLGIKEDHVKIIDDRHLPDDPDVQWNGNVIGNHILDMVGKHDIKTVITFDGKGVSSHPNHIAISSAVKTLRNHRALLTEVLMLETVNIVRKYSSWLDVVWTMVMTKHWISLNWAGFGKAQLSMRMHKSQYLWFRRLYVLFSRYMIINSFKKL